MKAWLLDEFTGLSALRLVADHPQPHPGPGEVLVRLHHASLNPADRFLAENLYPARPSLPHILGRDGVGTIEALGEGVSDARPGTRVIVLRGEAGVSRPGTFAEYVTVPKEVVVPAPAEWSDPEAAAAALVYVTAHQALFQWGSGEAGAVIISGVSGGVGLAAVHLAKAAGHRVIGLSRSPAKYDRLREEGCDLVLDPENEHFVRQVKDATNGRGADLAVDNVAGEIFSRLCDAMGPHGRISVVGMLAGPVPRFNTAKLLFKRLRIGGVSVSDYSATEAHTAWGDIVASLERIHRRPIVDTVFPMDQLVPAFERLAQGPLGKVVLSVR
ncbi:MAG: zinc-binding alcohol dehydrogenase family protein [Phycisphaerae bacterium]|nr:zinc-binding alcohol dehydrogenase family protein [Phycisphaerae bacterium]